MKRFTAVALTALMVLAVFASSASAADTVEIRSEVFNGTDIDAIVADYGGEIVIDATTFAGFFYDIDDDVRTEFLIITADELDTEGTIIAEGDLKYEIIPDAVDYEFGDFGEYNVAGFFAEAFVPVFEEGEAADNDVLAKLVLDSDEEYTMRTGETLDLGEGYALEAKQVDVDGKKAWFTFTKDGEFVEDKIITIDTAGNAAPWNVTEDVEDVTDAVVARIQVDEVFQGAVDSIVQIEGLWVIDYENAIEIESGDEFGEFDVDDVSEAGIFFESNDDVTLEADSVVDLYGNLNFKVADPDEDYLRFYAMAEYTEPGTYEVRGTVYDEDDAVPVMEWTATNFAGFFYDADDDVDTETLTIVGLDGNQILEGDLTYDIIPDGIDYEFGDFGQYNIAGFFADDFVPVFEEGEAADNDVLAKLVIDSDDEYTMRTGESLDLGEGYALEAKQVDVDGKKAWFTFTKDGEFVEDKIITIDDAGNAAPWNVTEDVEGVTDAVVARIQVDEVFQGAVDSIVQIEGLWVIDYENAIEIESGDEFGEFDVDDVNEDGIFFESNDDITLEEDSVVDLYGNLKFRVADNDTLRFYPFSEEIIEGAEEEPAEPEVGPEEAPEEAPEEEVAPEEAPEEEVAPEEAPEEGPEEEPVEEPEEGAPGFGFVFGLAGLLSVVYLVRRNN